MIDLQVCVRVRTGSEVKSVTIYWNVTAKISKRLVVQYDAICTREVQKVNWRLRGQIRPFSTCIYEETLCMRD